MDGPQGSLQHSSWTMRVMEETIHRGPSGAEADQEVLTGEDSTGT